MFHEVKPEALREHPFMLIEADGTLITACMQESINTMTASWGVLGYWGGGRCHLIQQAHFGIPSNLPSGCRISHFPKRPIAATEDWLMDPGQC